MKISGSTDSFKIFEAAIYYSFPYALSEKKDISSKTSLLSGNVCACAALPYTVQIQYIDTGISWLKSFLPQFNTAIKQTNKKIIVFFRISMLKSHKKNSTRTHGYSDGSF